MSEKQIVPIEFTSRAVRDGMPETIAKDEHIRSLFDHHQEMYRFENGYGVSVVRGGGTYGYDKGLFEVAAIVWQDNKESNGPEWDFVACGETGDRNGVDKDDVHGYKNHREVADFIDAVRGWQAWRTATTHALAHGLRSGGSTHISPLVTS